MVALENECLRVEIAALGGEMQSIRGRSGREYLWQGDAAYWSRRAPNLFPCVGGLTDGVYTLRGQTYALPRHGFVPVTELQLEERTETACTFLLAANEGTRVCYPFAFAYRIRYALREAGVEVCYLVENTGGETMFFGLGAHPGFFIPKGQFDACKLVFDAPCAPVRIGVSEKGFVTPRRAAYPLKRGRELPLAGVNFPESLVLTGMSRAVTLCDGNSQPVIRMDFADFPFLVLWRSPGAPFLCIEPWHGLPSREGIREDFATQPSLVCLESGAQFRAAFTITVFEQEQEAIRREKRLC